MSMAAMAPYLPELFAFALVFGVCTDLFTNLR